MGAHVKIGGEWKELTWGEIVERVTALAEGFIELGLKPGDRVAIFADTSFEWCLADFAQLCAGGISVPIYGSNTPEEVAFILKDSGVRFVVVDHDLSDSNHRQPGRWSRIKSIRDALPDIEHFIALKMPSNPDDKLIGLDELERRGRARQSDAGHSSCLPEIAARVGEDDLSCILYTSGTVGTPKGVMLTHRNWVSQSFNVMRSGVLVPGDQVMLFLPLAHSFGRAVEMTWMGQDISVSFAESIDKLLENAKELSPTVLPAVPRVFEKAFNRVVATGRASEGLQGNVFDWAMSLFEDYATAKAAGRPFRSLRFPIARQLVFSKISQKLKAQFGGRIRCFISGGAPLTPRIAYFFDLCGLNVCEGFGMTETCAPTHCNLTGKLNHIGTCGRPFPGVEAKVAEDGEILLRGPQIMKGYYNLPRETQEALSADGWLSTGDIGTLDAEGYMTITDRKKDLIKTSGGKYVAPAEIENDLKTNALVSQVSIQGDKRNFVSALFTLNEEETRALAKERGLDESQGFARLTKAPEIIAELQKIVDSINARQPSYATIKKFVVLDHDWSQETGELTPTLKVKRRVVGEKYKKELDELYR
ncbi:MAG: long-chain fatty acid--CoA ligase [Myxococcales bacterium]|nr:long-chain fatty acid--CoA ligase [Myxococcales bacterium]